MSRFDKVLKVARKEPDPEPEPVAEEPAPQPAEPAQPESKRGRPVTGKRSNDEYTQVTAYVRKDTYKQVKIALLNQDQPQEFSDLLESLLADWLKTQ